MHVLVSGARGFIGSAFVRHLLEIWRENLDLGPTGITKITAFARNTNDWTKPRLEGDRLVPLAQESGDLRLVYGDLNGDISGLCEGIDAVVHFAAKTYVDHSIRDPGPFIQSNTVGTANLLEEANRQSVKAFINISTDEVYGQILEGAYTEDARICPRNPYAASKAGADALTISYNYTYKMWTAVTRTENNYGPYQHPQKAIPVFVGRALKDKPIPVYGDGGHVRQWLYVSDHISAIMLLLSKWQELPGGEIWHIAGQEEITNKELALRILEILHKPANLIQYIDDMDIRPGHDRRYALSCDKIRAIGWNPEIKLAEGIKKCVNWCAMNHAWLG
jgi:dTDP-glucose 4,6-dehydratase